mmetsp:Transcript_14492/g.42690  ORF Transcript_14492/g.42690 Transcript_14492/m.42690 type:complete len:200 (+) Transcript_14492:405-1004(+)
MGAPAGHQSGCLSGDTTGGGGGVISGFNAQHQSHRASVASQKSSWLSNVSTPPATTESSSLQRKRATQALNNKAARGAGAYERRFSRFLRPQTARTAASVASAVAATFFNKTSTSCRNCRGSPPSLNPVKASVRLPSTNDLVQACSAKGSMFLPAHRAATLDSTIHRVASSLNSSWTSLLSKAATPRRKQGFESITSLQ